MDGDRRGEADGGGTHHDHDIDSLGIGVVTVSSSRARELKADGETEAKPATEGERPADRRSSVDDPAGDAVVAAVEAAGHEVTVRRVVGDDYDRIQSTVDGLVERSDVDALVTTGGTGVTPDDVTVEAVEPLFSKRLPGFGELFRRRSAERVGTRVVGTRAAAGIAGQVPVFCLPGSEDAAELGVEEIVLPEAPHLAGLARRSDPDE